MIKHWSHELFFWFWMKEQVFNYRLSSNSLSNFKSLCPRISLQQCSSVGCHSKQSIPLHRLILNQIIASWRRLVWKLSAVWDTQNKKDAGTIKQLSSVVKNAQFNASELPATLNAWKFDGNCETLPNDFGKMPFQTASVIASKGIRFLLYLVLYVSLRTNEHFAAETDCSQWLWLPT